MVEKQKALEKKPEEIKKAYKDLKVGDKVTVVSKLPNFPGDKIGSKDVFSGTVVGRDDKIGAVYIEAPLTDEWRNLWKARLHKWAPFLPPTLLNVAMVQLNELDPIGWDDWANKNMAKYLGGWFSRVELRETKKGPVLRYILYEDDVNKGYVKELNVGKKLTREEMMAALGGEMKPSPYGPIKGEQPKKVEKVVLKKQPSGPSTVGGRAVSREQIEELEEKTDEELLNSITLNYPVPGKYKGYSYMGGVNGLQRGVDVAALQILLNRILGTDLTVNGVYDERTAAAVKALQNRVGVRQDGLFGIDTKTGLREYLKKKEGETKPVPGEEEKAPKAPGEEEVAPAPKKEEVSVDITVYTPIHVDHNIRMDKMNENEIKEDGEGVKELMQEKDISKGKKAGRPGVPELYFIHSDIRAEGTKKNPRRFEDIMKNYLFVRTPEGELLSFDAFQKEYKLGKRTMGVFSWTKTSNEIFRYVAKNRLSIVFKLSEDRNLLPEDLKPYAGGWAEGIVEVANPESNYLRVKIVRVRKGFEEETREETSAPIGTISEESAEAPPLGEGMGGEETKAEEGEKV